MKCAGRVWAKRRADWFSGIQVSAVALAETCVEKGYGLAVIVGIPGMNHRSQVRMLPLVGFPTVPFGVLGHGIETPVLNHFLKVVQATAAKLGVRG